MPPRALDDLPLARPIPYRSAADPDGLDLNTLLIPSPLTTFFMRVRGHRLRAWGVQDGDLLLIDRAIDPRPGHLLVVARGGRFLLRSLVAEEERWQLAPLAAAEAPIPLDRLDPHSSGVFGVAVQTVHHLLKTPGPRKGRGPGRGPRPQP
jgi:DNA polymerase V